MSRKPVSMRKRITCEQLKRDFLYNPETGELFRRVGYYDNKYGYLRISIDGINYLGQQLAWLWMTGEWIDRIDHEDGNKSNNRWTNLREATQSQNSANARKITSVNGKRTSSPFKGVYFDKLRRKWCAAIKVNYRKIHLGRHNTEDEARAAYWKAAQRIFGEFARSM